jgi:hypothetical protein
LNVSGLVDGVLVKQTDRLISTGVSESALLNAVTLSHQRDKDQYLDSGGPNQVSAAELKSLLSTDFRVRITSSDDISPSDEGALIVITAAGTYTLPSVPAHFRVCVKRTNPGTGVGSYVTLVPTVGTVDGASSYDLKSQYDSGCFVFDGSNWLVI